MAEELNSYDITATFAKWLGKQKQSNEPAVVLLYRSQPADPKRQVPEAELSQIVAACKVNAPPIPFAAVDTREVADAFVSLGVQSGTPKLAFVRGVKGAGTTLLNPRLDLFKRWIKGRLKP